MEKNALCMSGVEWLFDAIFFIYIRRGAHRCNSHIQFIVLVQQRCAVWHSGAKIWGKKCNLRCSEDWNRCDICLLLHIFKSVIFVFIFSENSEIERAIIPESVKLQSISLYEEICLASISTWCFVLFFEQFPHFSPLCYYCVW